MEIFNRIKGFIRALYLVLRYGADEAERRVEEELLGLRCERVRVEAKLRDVEARLRELERREQNDRP